jgi:diguanylate cyclase (GGDEF)-like protein
MNPRIPFTKLRNVIVQILNAGHQYAHSNSESRRIFQVNLAAFLSASFGVFFVGFFSFAQNPVLKHQAYVLSLFLIIFSSVPFFNAKGWLQTARYVLTLSGPLSICVGVFFFQGTYLDLHFYFLLFAILPGLCFPPKAWPVTLLFFIASLSIFIYCYLIGVTPAFELYSLEESIVQKLKFVTLIVGILALHALVLFSEIGTQQNELKLEGMSNTDALTGILNRRGFEAKLQEIEVRFRRSAELGALVFLDLDHFKPLNDKYGHKAGDLLLKQVALRIHACLRESDIVARYGGDEFVIFLSFPGNNALSQKERVEVVAEKIRKAISEDYLIEARRHKEAPALTHHCSASLGVCLFKGVFDLEEVLKIADQAMYRAKKLGKDRVCFNSEN